MVVVFDVYHVIPPALSIIEEGTIDLNSLEFPFSHLYYASNMIIFDMGGFGFARFFPTFLSFSVVLYLFTISKRIDKRYSVIAPLAFLSLNWYMEYHMARQAFGVLIWMSFFIFLFLTLEKKQIRLGVITGVLLITILLSHPGIIIIVGFNLTALAVITVIFYISKKNWDYLWPTLPYFIVFAVAMIIAYYTIPQINLFFYDLYQQVISRGFEGFALGGPGETSLQYAVTNNIRKSMGIFQSLTALIGIYVFYKKESYRSIFFGAWFISCYFWLSYSLTHNGFLIERAFLTALLPASILIVALFKDGISYSGGLKSLVQVGVIVILCIFLLMIPISKNSIDSFETPSKQAYTAGRFAQNNLENRVWITDTHQGMFRYLEATSNSSVRFRARTESANIDVEGMTFGYRLPATDRTDLPDILFLDYFKNYILVRYGNETSVRQINDYEERISSTHNKIYNSGGARHYTINS